MAIKRRTTTRRRGPRRKNSEPLRSVRRRRSRTAITPPSSSAPGWFEALLLRQRRYLETRRRSLQRADRKWATRPNQTEWTPPWRIRLLFQLVLLQERAWTSVTHRRHQVKRRLRRLPRDLQAGAIASRKELSTKEGRKGLRRAILDESLLNPSRRRALLFVSGIYLVLAWVLVELLARTVAPEALPFKRQTDVLLYYGIATRLFLPTPFEVILPSAAKVLGAPVAVFVASLGAVIGSWILFLLGTQAHKGIGTTLQRWGWGRAAWAWLERYAPRFGYAIMGAILAVPFTPDSLTAIFAVLGLRLRWFLLTIFLATLVRHSLVVWLF